MSPHTVVLYLQCSWGVGKGWPFKLYSTLADVYVANNMNEVMVVHTHWGCQSVVFIGGGTPKKLSITQAEAYPPTLDWSHGFRHTHTLLVGLQSSGGGDKAIKSIVKNFT